MLIKLRLKLIVFIVILRSLDQEKSACKTNIFRSRENVRLTRLISAIPNSRMRSFLMLEQVPLQEGRRNRKRETLVGFGKETCDEKRN